MTKKPGLSVIIGIGKPKGPMPEPPKGGGPAPDEESREQSGQKASIDEAACFTGQEQCVNCAHFLPETSECKVVEGNGFGNQIQGCVKYFEPAGAEEAEGEDEGAQPDATGYPK